MKKHSKILIVLLSLALVIGATLMAVGAAETVEYTFDLAAAVASAGDGDTITLTGNAKIDSTITVDKNLTIDIGSYRLDSSAAAVFAINSSVDFTVTGSGSINVDGTLIYSTTTTESPVVTVDGYGIGFYIGHTGTAAGNLVKAATGTYTLKDVKIVSSSSSLVDLEGVINVCHVVNKVAPCSANVTLDNVYMQHTALRSDPNKMIVRVGGKEAHLTIKDSQLYGNNSGIHVGFIDAKDRDTEAVLIENSLISTKTDISNKYIWTIFTEKVDKAAGWVNKGTVGIINIKDSTVQGDGRILYGDYQKSPETDPEKIDGTKDGLDWSITSKIVVDNSAIISSGSSGSNNSNVLFRNVRVEFKNNSRYSGVAGGGSAFHTNPKVTLDLGTRINITAVGNATELTKPEDSVWVYDPVGNTEFPYVLVSADDAAAYSNLIYNVNYGFEAIYSKPASNNDPYIIVDRNAKVSNYTDGEIFWFKHTSAGMQWDVKAGSIYRVPGEINSYLKFVVTASSQSDTHVVNGNSVKFKTDPYLIMGGSASYSVNKAHVMATEGYQAIKMAILNFDFGAENDLGWPSTSIDTQARKGTGGSGDSIGAFSISRNGTIEYKDTMYNTNPNAKVNPAGEWNHLTVVFYEDPAITVNGETNVGIAHYYLNGVYMGYTRAHTANADSFIMGARFNFAAEADFLLGAAIAYDNISFRAYTDYIGGEVAGSLGTSNATAAQYVDATPENKFIGDNHGYAINGVKSDKDINAALAEAAAGNDMLELLGNVTVAQKITTNGYLATNGYNIEIDPASYGYETLTDANGNAVYKFSDAFNQEVEYKFYVGNDFENYSDGLYASVKYKYGNLPEHDFVNIDLKLSSDGRSATAAFQNGWITDKGEPLAALTLEMIEATKDTGVKVYPTFGELKNNVTAYTKDTATGKFVAAATSASETMAQYKALKGNKTFVFLSDTEFTSACKFYDDTITKTVNDVKTVNGVAIDNDYTDEDIAKMREVAQVINVDFNGYAVSSSTGFATVSNNTVMNIYSSVPGATFVSIRVNGSNVGGQRALAIMHRDGSESLAIAKSVFNAELNIGSITDADGNVLYKNNLAVMGGFLIEGHTGDRSCELNGNDLHIYQIASESDSLIIARYFYGNMNFNGCTIASNVNHQTVSARVRGSGADACTPDIIFDNCIIIQQGERQDVIRQDGYNNNAPEEGNTRIIFNNCQISGRVNYSDTNKSVKTGEGTAATTFAADKHSVSGVTKAYYNVPMKASLDGSARFVAVPLATLSGGKAILSGSYMYFVEAAYMAEFKAANPDVADSNIVELGLLTQKVVKTTDTVSVKYENLDGTVNATHTYAIGGYVVPETVKTGGAEVNTPLVAGGSVVSGALKITAAGDWAIPEGPVTEALVIKPDGYNVTGNIDGIKANLSIYSDFGVNVYIPASYSENIVSVQGDGKSLLPMSIVTIGDQSFIKTTISRAAKDAATNAVVTFKIKDTYEGKEYDATASVTLNVVSYAAKVLALESATDADKELMYQMLTYANEAIKFRGGNANETITALIGENTVTEYNASEESVGTAALSAAFEGATVDTGEDLAFVFVLKNGFAGKVTVKNGGFTYTFDVDADDSRVIRIGGMKVYNFAHNLEVSAEGTIGEEAVNAQGMYNLATFVKYHIDGAAASNAESVACVEFAKAFYNYSKCALAYVTAK